MSRINSFLLRHNLRIAHNPCVSPDFCLDWSSLRKKLQTSQAVTDFPRSRFEIAAGNVTLTADETGDHAWLVESTGVVPLSEGVKLRPGLFAYPASYENLLGLKNLVQQHDVASTIFPSASDTLAYCSLGVGARFTTLHWPAVEWAMSHLKLSMTANQNSIPRELVYDVDEMLADKLDTVPFPFIGCAVPEGHQGQSVQGMSHGAILSKLKTGFHTQRIPWGFNADHQPIGGKFDSREDQLVEGCALASYITFDLSPELALTQIPETAQARQEYVRSEVPDALLGVLWRDLESLKLSMTDDKLNKLLAYVWPAMVKMRRRDEKYRAIREKLFVTQIGRAYYRELSIDELPGLTSPETTAVMLLLCREMEMPVQYIAPAFGFQKNFPYPDNNRLRELIELTWHVCRELGVSIGFHSGSGKSAENYRIMGEVTGGHLEIKTSGRYTYEMGAALSQSNHPYDHKLWIDWYDFTREMAIAGAFNDDVTERTMAREFITQTLKSEKKSTDVFASQEGCRAALAPLAASPDHMYWFEYNFLYILAAEGKADKSALGNHTLDGYMQRARFYAISEESRLNYSRRVAEYLIFLAETSGLSKLEQVRNARVALASYETLSAFEAGIGKAS